MRKYIFIINPAAGKGTLQHQLIQSIKQQLNPEQYEIYETTYPGDEQDFVQKRLNPKEDLWFFACGGDGTIANLVNALAGKAPLGIIPCGSGNDFAKVFINADLFDLTAQTEGTPVAVDVLSCNGQLAANVVNLGFDADVAYHMIHFKRLPGVSGNMSYIISLLYCFSHKVAYPMKIWLDDDTEPIEGEFLFSLFANGQIYGGSFHGAPKAEINDGVFDVCLCRKAPRLKILRLVPAFQKGEHLSKKDFEEHIIYRQCKRAKILVPEPTVLGLDGNCEQVTGEIEILLLPEKLQLIVPKGAHLKMTNEK